MHFCDNCDNMYYIRIDSEDENKLLYYNHLQVQRGTSLITTGCLASFQHPESTSEKN